MVFIGCHACHGFHGFYCFIVLYSAPRGFMKPLCLETLDADRGSRDTDGFMNVIFFNVFFAKTPARVFKKKIWILNRDSHFLLSNFLLRRGGCT